LRDDVNYPLSFWANELSRSVVPSVEWLSTTIRLKGESGLLLEHRGDRIADGLDAIPHRMMTDVRRELALL